jgi:two-component system, LuxR family, response regulator FixJ
MKNSGVIHVVDDDQPVRDSLGFRLRAASLEVRLYESAQALLARGDGLEPGCIITDVRMPGMSGIELIAKLKENGAPHPVIVLTGHADVPLAVTAMKAGVVDFLEKPFDDDVLLRAIATALARDQVGDRSAERAAIEARVERLTAREKDVFDAVVAGDSNKAAGQRLGISPRTVEIHRAHAMEKMEARTLSDLVRMAIQRELLR